MAQIQRINQNRQDPNVKGEGDEFLIPLDILPDGMTSGEKVRMIIEGTLNIGDEGGIIRVDRIYPEKANQRTDAMQDRIEEGLDIEISLKQK